MSEFHAKELFEILQEKNERIMFIESCTGGMAAGTLVTHCPGISQYLYGSKVVYTAEAKSKWLNIDPNDLEKFGTESFECAVLLAGRAAYQDKVKAFSVVGHLNDNSFIYVAYSKPSILPCVNENDVKRFDLSSNNRFDRMQEALIEFYSFVSEKLENDI